MADRLAGQQCRLPGGGLDWPLPGAELALAIERLQARGLAAVFQQGAQSSALLPRLLNGIACKKIIAGPAVCIHPDDWSVCITEIADLYLAQDPISACQALLERGLFEPGISMQLIWLRSDLRLHDNTAPLRRHPAWPHRGRVPAEPGTSASP